jgi:hypothetical protein
MSTGNRPLGDWNELAEWIRAFATAFEFQLWLKAEAMFERAMEEWEALTGDRVDR